MGWGGQRHFGLFWFLHSSSSCTNNLLLVMKPLKTPWAKLAIILCPYNSVVKAGLSWVVFSLCSCLGLLMRLHSLRTQPFYLGPSLAYSFSLFTFFFKKNYFVFNFNYVCVCVFVYVVMCMSVQTRRVLDLLWAAYCESGNWTWVLQKCRWHS